MNIPRCFVLVVLAAAAGRGLAQNAPREPHIGYLYPAGGRQGTVVQVSAGGQFLKDARTVLVSGPGVRATVVRHIPPLKKPDKAVVQEIRDRLKLARLAPASAPPMQVQTGSAETMAHATGAVEGPVVPVKTSFLDPQTAAMLDHPLLKNLEQLSPKELQYVAKEFRKRNRRQRNAQLAETVIIEVAIDANAPVGDRELRVQTPIGLTNPLVFQVGTLPELMEHEPNNPDWPDTPRVDIPAVLNGQLLPGDIDCYRFRATAGHRLVIQAQARHLVPYLADAVPGWFQATLALYDSRGDEVAYADDSGFDPDPVIVHDVPATGDFTLEIRDAIHRGRQDFVYRVCVTEDPAAGPRGSPRITPWDRVALPGPAPSPRAEPWARVDALPEAREREPNGTAAQALVPPVVVCGTIAEPGDVDLFKFDGRANDVIVAEVTARRLSSPLDSLLRLSDATGKVLAWNDDRKEVEAGLLTHHADSYLSVKLPADGTYFLRLTDAQRHGGPDYSYRLRVSGPRPDFAVFLTPSSVNMTPAPAVVLGVQALRRDGFDGEIDLSLKGSPAGFALGGATIPRGRDSVRMTLTAPPGALDPPAELQVEARATIDGQSVTRAVIPADDQQQAFATRHLVPSQGLLVSGRGNRRLGAAVRLGTPTPVSIPRGGTARVLVRVPRAPILSQIQLELSDPPKGISLESTSIVPEGLALDFKASDSSPAVGYSDNLIVEVFWERPPPLPKDGKPAKPRGRVSRGVLPAIPVRIAAGP